MTQVDKVEAVEKILEKYHVCVDFIEHVDSNETWDKHCKEYRKELALAIVAAIGVDNKKAIEIITEETKNCFGVPLGLVKGIAEALSQADIVEVRG